MKAFDEAMPQFERLDTQVLGISVDSVPCKEAWAKSLVITSFPFVSDFWPHGGAAQQYGILREEGYSERGVFVVDKRGTVRFAKVYPIEQLPPMEEVLDAVRTLGSA